jgi:hypothetical protein
VIAIMPVKTAALIQMKTWIRRNFSSCNSTAKSCSRSCTMVSRPSPSVRSEAMKPGVAGVSMATVSCDG